jgi:hypothetical protein
MWYFAVGKPESDRISATSADKKSALMNLWKDVRAGEKAEYAKACDPRQPPNLSSEFPAASGYTSAVCVNLQLELKLLSPASKIRG